MKPLNTLPIEEFLDKARVAIKSNKRELILSIKEVTDLQNSLSVVMTRMNGELDQLIANASHSSTIVVEMDGGKF